MEQEEEEEEEDCKTRREFWALDIYVVAPRPLLLGLQQPSSFLSFLPFFLLFLYTLRFIPVRENAAAPAAVLAHCRSPGGPDLSEPVSPVLTKLKEKKKKEK